MEDITSILNTDQQKQHREPPKSLRRLHESANRSETPLSAVASELGSLVDKLGSATTDELIHYQINIISESASNIKPGASKGQLSTFHLK